MTNSKGSHFTFRAGVFWLVDTSDELRHVRVSWPIDVDTPRFGSATDGYDHEQAWRHICRLDRTLGIYAFDHFPRGRVTYFPPTRRWLLGVDVALARPDLVAQIVERWRLPPGHITTVVELTYCSAAHLRAMDV